MKIELNTIYNENCEETMKRMKGKSIDITSKTIKMLNSVNMINIFVETINKLRLNSQTEV